MTQMSHPSYDLLAATSWFCHMPSLAEQKIEDEYRALSFISSYSILKIKRENYIKLHVIINRYKPTEMETASTN